jgi:hypothetical protein
MKNKLILLLLPLLFAGCTPPETVPYSALVSGLTNLNAIARLDAPATQLISSYDRTGANEDYNHFQGKTKDGQVILADLKGPGVMTRFWFTGIGSDKKIRLTFDGEKMPRFEFTWNELRAGVPPFNSEPLSMDEQNCWYTFVPVPFKKRLLITTEDAGYAYGKSPKMYYQLNWHPMPVGQTVESLPSGVQGLEEICAATQGVSKGWKTMDFGPLPPADQALTLSAGQTVELWSGQGPSTLEAFTIESAVSDPEVLRNVLLKMYWDGLAEPSVAVPLGDFFGSVWQRWRSQSMFFGSIDNTFFCRFLMPFRESGRLVLENQSDSDLSLHAGFQTGPYVDGGYFHAAWRNSGAAETGAPHTVLETTGRGRYVGCLLAVNSADRSFWALESDESMRIDGQKTWQGTGLEDYFNSGWYYGNVFARPLHGLPDKAPFRTVQYRLHLTEPVLFDQSFKMDFERGPNQASHAAYESMAFYYLEAPQAANSQLFNRTAPADPLRQYTLMTDLWNFEHFGDLRGEAEYINRYLAQYKPSFSAVLKARAQACRYELGEGSLDGAPDELVALYTEEHAAVIQLYCNMATDLYLDGEPVLRSSDSTQPVSKMITLRKGRHVLVVASVWQQYPKWTQVAVRTANGFLIGTSGEWKHAVNPSGNWVAMDYDDSAWLGFKNYDGRVKGPPEEPYIWVQPDPFINTLSQALGLRPSALWKSKKGRVVYRQVFDVE